MKPMSAALRALLATRQFYVADLFTFTLIGGGVLRYCAGDQDVTYNGMLYAAGGQTGPYFDRQNTKAQCHWKTGTAVDTLTFDVIPGAATVFGAPFLAAILQGQFDNAEMTLERLFMPTYGDASRGAVRLFAGRVVEIDCGRSIATFQVNDHRELMALNLPRNLFQPGCTNTLGDAACGVALAAYTTTGSALAGSTGAVIAADITNALAGYYDQGTVTFTSGVLAGLSRSVKTCAFGAPGTIALIGPFPSAPAAGDAFTIGAGCDKSYNGVNGCPKFANVPRFRAQPFIPQPVVAI